LTELSANIGRDVLLTNASINGNTTRQALERMPYDIQSQNPDIIIVQFGMNDCNYWQTDRGNPRVSPQAFKANLEEIIARAFTFGVEKILINTNHPTGRDKNVMPCATTTYQQSNERYNQIIRSVASAFGQRVVLNDIETACLENTRGDRSALLRLVLPEPDLLHLSEAGHDLYFDLICPSVKQAILELTRA
jgi:acyl-CoA thioesterase-1